MAGHKICVLDRQNQGLCRSEEVWQMDQLTKGMLNKQEVTMMKITMKTTQYHGKTKLFHYLLDVLHLCIDFRFCCVMCNVSRCPPPCLSLHRLGEMKFETFG